MHIHYDVLVLATQNKGKINEFKHALAQYCNKIQSMNDFENLPPIVEDGDTFAHNAWKKAQTIGDAVGLYVLADDSGLCVEQLDGAPGVYSARYAGEHASDVDNNLKLLRALGVSHLQSTASFTLLSRAYYECVLVLYNPSTGQKLQATGKIEGWIIDQPRGLHGFGYDRVFYIPQKNKTMAELTMEEKQAISHRGSALQNLLQYPTEI